jgi:hypothetical protein
MATLDADDRDKLRASQFAYVDRKGGEHLPIHDESHVRNAMARFNQTDFQSKTAKEQARRRIKAAAKKFGIEISPDSNVARPSK